MCFLLDQFIGSDRMAELSWRRKPRNPSPLNDGELLGVVGFFRSFRLLVRSLEQVICWNIGFRCFYMFFEVFCTFLQIAKPLELGFLEGRKRV